MDDLTPGTAPAPAPPAVPDHRGRRDRLRLRLAQAGLDVLVVTGAANVRYLTGFSGSNGQVIVADDPAGDRLVTDGRYEERAAREAPTIPAVIERRWLATVVDHLGQLGAGVVGFEGAHLDHATGTRLADAVVDVGAEARSVVGHVEELREIKDAYELGRLRAACDITDAAFEQVLEQLRPGLTERDVAVRFERTCVDLGADGLAFPTIVASGPNGAVPHHEPGPRVLERGDLVTIDGGARVDGYHADETRTVALGAPDPLLAEVYALVARAQQAGVDAACAGATGEQVDAACREVITAAGHGERFVHGTGHGIGLEIHEAPALAAASGTGAGLGPPAARLRPGTAMTVEPGVYLPRTGGIRIEDAVVVVAAGPAERLTRTSRELRSL